MTNAKEILEIFAQTFRQGNRFDESLGLQFEILSPGHILYEMSATKEYVSFGDILHGGALSAMMDATLGLAALSQAVPERKLVSTVEFKMNFIRPVHVGEKIIGEGKVQHHGKTLVISNASLFIEGSENLVAQGLGTFNKYPMEKKGLSNIYENQSDNQSNE